MLYELRHYDLDSERGLDCLNQRFADHTLRIWERIGIEPVGFWSTIAGTSMPRLTYILAWDDLAQRQALWDAFAEDPEWLEARAGSEAQYGGNPVRAITNSILKPTAFSRTPRRDNQPNRLSGGIFELREHSFPESGRLANASQWFAEQGMPYMEKHGQYAMGYWTTYIGISPRLTMMLVFENLAHRERAWAGYFTDPAWPGIEAGLYPDGQSLILNTESRLMKGTEFSGWR